MGAKIDAMLLGEADGPIHHHRISGMVTAGDVGRGDHAHQPGIVGNGVGAVALAQIGIDIDTHGVSLPD
ncbi:hypothetical protein D3C71_2206870 [compost metagenome]